MIQGGKLCVVSTPTYIKICMKNIFNIFSGKTYTDAGSSLISPDGEVFSKVFNGYLSQDGNLIQKVGDGFMNMTTGVQSSFGDPFEDEE